MDWKTRTKEWHDKATEEKDDYFVKFILEYLAFAGYITNCKYPDAGADGKAIQKLKDDDNIKTKYLEKINDNITLCESFNTIIEILDDSPLGNISYNIHDPQYQSSDPQIDEIAKRNNPNYLRRLSKPNWNGKIESLSDWNSMVTFWYTIRNNLFHGTKVPSVERDQFMVKYGYETLKELVNIMYDEYDQNQ